MKPPGEAARRLAAPIIDPRRYDAACLDYDGTLAMTAEMHLQARVDTLRAFQLTEEELPDELIWQSNRYGSTLDVILKGLLEANGFRANKETIRQMITHKEELIRMRASTGAQAYPEAVNRTYALKKHIGRLAIVTQASELEISTFLDSYELRRVFGTIICKNTLVRLEKQSKPHPDPYLLAAGRLDVNPATMLAIEDTPDGALSAMRAGAEVLALGNTTDLSDFEAMDSNAPHYFARNWAEVVILDEPPGQTLPWAA